MKGIVNYYEADPEMINSVEGWVVNEVDGKSSYFVEEDCLEMEQMEQPQQAEVWHLLTGVLEGLD